MTDKEKEIIEKAGILISVANGFRLLFMFIALLLLLFVFFGGKFWGNAEWFETFVRHAYSFLFWDILLMLISTMLKIFFTVRYNRIVKSMPK